MKETGCWMFLFYCLGFISEFVCELERMHMLVIYIEYQGLFMSGLETLNSPKKHETHLNLFSTAQLRNLNVKWHIFKPHFDMI